MKFASMCVAGTFDGLHKGHEALLFRAFAEGEQVLIGMTSDTYVKAHKRGAIRKYTARFQDLTRWIETNGFSVRTTIVSIDDPFEPAASDASLDALVVSEDSKGNGEELNRRRIARGLNSLVLCVVLLVPAEDLHPISSTRMRSGEIDRKGSLILPESLRIDLLKPLGRIIFCFERPGLSKLIISVGDLTTKTALESGITPYLMIIDNKVGRETYIDLMPMIQKRGFRVQRVASGPGFISREAHRLIQTFPTGVIEVEGEEDLLVLPAIVAAPNGSVVYYGQPGSGMVEVVVTEEKKREVNLLLRQFIS